VNEVDEDRESVISSWAEYTPETMAENYPVVTNKSKKKKTKASGNVVNRLYP
jgi:hypothetical protein